MNTLTRKVRVLFIDDNKVFLEKVLEETKHTFNVKTLNSATQIDEIINTVKSFKAEHIIIDVNLHNAMALDLIIQKLAEQDLQQSFHDHKIWLISQITKGYGDLLKRLKSKNTKVQDKIITKPIEASKLKSILLSESFYEKSDWEDNFPLPLRIISADLKVVYTNKRWCCDEYSPPIGTYQQNFKEHRLPERKDHLGAFFDPKATGFSLDSFWIEKENENFLAQVVENHPLTQVPKNLDTAIDDVFHAMNSIGYRRGRYYRIHRLAEYKKKNPDYSLTLRRLSKGHPDTAKPGYRIKLDGELEKRILQLSKRNADGTINYHIRDREDDTNAKDPKIEQLNNYLGVNNLQKWMELPVLSKNHPIGLFVFDKGNAVEDSSHEQENENITVVESTITNLLNFIRSALQQQHIERLENYDKTTQKLDKKLHDSTDRKEQYRYILKALIHTNRMTKKNAGAVLILRQGQSPMLRFKAHYGTVPKCINTLNLPLTETTHPIVQAWQEKRFYAIQDFCDKEITNHLETQQPHYWKSLPSDTHKKLTDWFASIQSVLYLPVTIQGEVIGCLAIYFCNDNNINQRYKITLERLKRSYTVIARARWVLQSTLTKERHDIWQMALGHELKSELYAAEDNFYSLEENNPSLKKEEYWIQGLLFLKNSVDRCINWVDILRNDSRENRPVGWDDRFTPKESIKSYIDLNYYKLNMENINIHQHKKWDDPIWKINLLGSELHYARVIRILLDNAFKHGVSYQQKDHPEKVDINITAYTDKKYFIISIINPSHMDDDEYSIRFKPREFPINRHVDGSHVGLSIAKSIVADYNGKLTVENKESNTVEVLLYWKLAK